MSVTTAIQGINQLKGPHAPGDQRAYEIVLNVTGTYATASKPNFNILTALQAMHEGITACQVNSVAVFQDYNDGTNTYTAPGAYVVLSTTGNNVATFRIDSGAVDGATGSEIADSTALALPGRFTFIVLCSVTGPSL